MAQYISKSALVAEIERMLKNVNLNYVNTGSHPSALDTNKKLQEGISKNLQSILSFINTLEVKEVQKEPAKDKFAFKAIPRLLEMIEPTDRAKTYTAKLADALEVEGYSTDAKIVREKIKVMNGEKVSMATMDEESVSEDLEEAIGRSFICHENHGDDFRSDKQIETAYRYGFETGAKWQKAKDQETIELAEDHGMEKMREQTMKNAFEGEVVATSDCGWESIRIYKKEHRCGDKVKVIILKDE